MGSNPTVTAMRTPEKSGVFAFCAGREPRRDRAREGEDVVPTRTGPIRSECRLRRQPWNRRGSRSISDFCQTSQLCGPGMIGANSCSTPRFVMLLIRLSVAP